MENSNLIYNKLEGFIKKYYTNELLKGIIFFIGLGLIYFLVTLFVEYFLWLKSFWRSLLFWSFVLVELLLIARYILFPISKLFKINKGLNYEQASVLIGNHFSDVSDKLTNYLQLDAAKDKSELLLASIEQKAAALKFVPFASAINFNGNKRYLPLAIFPLFLIFFLFISGNSTLISQSLNRVVHYKQQFLPPAPFQFLIVNTNLQTEQNKDFSLQVITKGKIVPENIVIHIDNESYFLEKDADGKFTYKFTKPTTDVEFYLEANTVISTDYKLKVVTVPSIVNFEMALNFPSYLNKKSEQIKGTGNAIIPEGTVVTWKMNTLATDQVDWTDLSNVFQFKKQSNLFYFSKNINQNTEYQIVNSNSKIKNYEKLNYHIEVIKDQFPVITVINTPDSLKTQKEYLHGQVSDDYGLSKLQIVYYEKDKPQTAKRGTIPLKKDIFDQFIFAFPSTLNVVQGVTYDYYFEIFDNDVLHGFKSSKTSVFSTKITTDSEKQDQIFKQQNDNISGIQKSLKSQDKQLSELSKLQKMSKEKDNFDFKDQQKVNDFVKRQQTQDEMMKQFAEKMKNNLEKFNQEKNDTFKAELEKRLENAAKEIEKNKKLLEELNQLNDKIKHDELIDKLDQFKQTAKTQAKSLEQLVELTDRKSVV